jgi:predicted regulator of Ras-like GTPase activity (Roadblock/LC7/MglB family)
VRGGIDRVQNFLDQLQRTEARAMIVVSVEALPLDGQQDGNLEGDIVATISGGIWVTPDA